MLEPFGKGNTKPVFAEKNLVIRSARVLGRNKNVLKMRLENAEHVILDAVYFGEVEKFIGLPGGKIWKTGSNRASYRRQKPDDNPGNLLSGNQRLSGQKNIADCSDALSVNGIIGEYL